MELFRIVWLQQIVCFLLMVAAFNISIDPPDNLTDLDSNPLSLEEDLTINEMESFLEVLLEIGLNKENALPESDESERTNFQEKSDSFFLDIHAYILVCVVNSIANRTATLETDDRFVTRSLAIPFPPPKN